MEERAKKICGEFGQLDIRWQTRSEKKMAWQLNGKGTGRRSDQVEGGNQILPINQ